MSHHQSGGGNLTGMELQLLCELTLLLLLVEYGLSTYIAVMWLLVKYSLLLLLCELTLTLSLVEYGLVLSTCFLVMWLLVKYSLLLLFMLLWS